MQPQQQPLARNPYTAAKGKALISGYLEQEVMQWSPEKIILKTYDFFLVNAKKKDIVRMNKALDALIGALNFEYKDQAVPLFRLYQYCQRCISTQKYDEAIHIIQELRTSWATAFNLSA
jgi:flagellin-specific chaperone FliS